MNETLCCSTCLSAFGVTSVIDVGHSDRCVVVSHWISISLITFSGVSFHMLICHLYIIFDEVSVQVFGPLFNCFFINNNCVLWIIIFFEIFRYFSFSFSLYLLLARVPVTQMLGLSILFHSYLSLCPFYLQFSPVSFKWVNSTNLLSSSFVFFLSLSFYYSAITPVQCFGFCLFIHEEE